MTDRADLPTIDQLPIPLDVAPGPGWTDQMKEMADHIGPYATLMLVARFSGERIYIARGSSNPRIVEAIGEDAARILAWTYGGAVFTVPVARQAVNQARRAPVLAAVRAKRMSGADAAKVLGTSRSYLAHLVNQTDEGARAVPVKLPRRAADPRQIDMFPEV